MPIAVEKDVTVEELKALLPKNLSYPATVGEDEGKVVVEVPSPPILHRFILKEPLEREKVKEILTGEGIFCLLGRVYLR